MPFFPSAWGKGDNFTACNDESKKAQCVTVVTFHASVGMKSERGCFLVVALILTKCSEMYSL